MILALLLLHVLGEAVDVADIPVMIIVGHVEGRRAARVTVQMAPDDFAQEISALDCLYRDSYVGLVPDDLDLAEDTIIAVVARNSLRKCNGCQSGVWNL